MTYTQTRWVLASVPSKSPDGGYPVPKVSDFKAIREPAPTAAGIKDGEVLIKHHFLSPDPYILAFKTKKEYLGKTVWAGAAGEVIASKSDKFSAGDIVYGGGMVGRSHAHSHQMINQLKKEKNSSHVHSTNATTTVRLNRVFSAQS